MDQNLLEQATSLIAGFEAFRSHSYPDPATKGPPWTVGFGATGPNIGPNTVWTYAQAKQDLQNRIEKLYGQIEGLIVTPLNNNQWSALLSFAYNCGIGAFEASHLRTGINAGITDPDAIKGMFTAWDHAAGKVNSDLLARRESEAALFLQGS